MTKIHNLSSIKEIENRAEFYEYFIKCPIPPKEMMTNLGLFLTRQTLSQAIFMHELYLKILPVNGIIIEFGTRWGRNMAIFSSFRGMYEPFNYSRKILGFDTFKGFISIAKQDGKNKVASKGAYMVTKDYDKYLESIMNYHESESPLSHIKKYEIIKGDGPVMLKKYLKKHPETIIALAYFDFDLYKPTKECLQLIRPYITKGTVIGFDELNWPAFPGETVALKEVFGLDKYAIQRTPLNPSPSYIVIN